MRLFQQCLWYVFNVRCIGVYRDESDAFESGVGGVLKLPSLLEDSGMVASLDHGEAIQARRGDSGAFWKEASCAFRR